MLHRACSSVADVALCRSNVFMAPISSRHAFGAPLRGAAATLRLLV
jgi:hypothetical protein